MGTFGATWGLAGVFLLLGSAVYRLSVVAASAFSYKLQLQHWVALLVAVSFMAYAEGYRAFQKRFSPRVAAMAKYLKNHPHVLHAVLASYSAWVYFLCNEKEKAHFHFGERRYSNTDHSASPPASALARDHRSERGGRYDYLLNMYRRLNLLRITEINTQPADDSKTGRHSSKTYISPLPILPLRSKLMIRVFLRDGFKKKAVRSSAVTAALCGHRANL